MSGPGVAQSKTTVDLFSRANAFECLTTAMQKLQACPVPHVTSLFFFFNQYHLDYFWDAISASASWRVMQREPLLLSFVEIESVLCYLGSSHSRPV